MPFPSRPFRLLIHSLLLIVVVGACTPECRQPDTSGVAVEVQPARLDEALWQANRADLDGANRELLQEFGAFYAIYVRDILRLGAPEDPGMGVRLNGFLSDATIREVFETCAAEFVDLSGETATLEQALRNYAHYFPERQVPKVVTCMSGFNYSVIATEDVLAVSLEMYLGAGSPFYRRQGLPAYQVRHMHREHLAMDALRAWLATEFPLPANEKELVTHMVHEGKLLYLMDAIFPCAPDSLKVKFTADQVAWCQDNEFNTWAHLIDQELLFSTDARERARLMMDAPFTSGLDPASPGRLGAWVGWQIVRTYMDKHPNVSPADLMAEADAQLLLRKSGYRPG